MSLPLSPTHSLSLPPCIRIKLVIIGVFLGYPEKDKHRVWVQCKKEDILAAESSAGDYNQLANALLDIVFKEELLTPDKYCCTSSKGKELLDEEKMRGIRSRFITTKSALTLYQAYTV